MFCQVFFYYKQNGRKSNKKCYFCGHLRKINMRKGQVKCVDWLEGFGQSKNYDIFFIKSTEQPIRLAHTLSALFNKPFAFLDDVAPLMDNPNRTFPLFFSMLSVSNGANLVVLPNRITIPAQDLGKGSDPLLGGFLFDDDYYLFNKQGNTTFKCDCVDYDYVMMLYCDKNFEAAEEVESVLKEKSSFRMVKASNLLQLNSTKAIDKKRVDFLQRLFVDIEILVGDFLENMLSRKMNGVTEIPSDNYTVHRFEMGKTSLLPILSSPLMRRENI